jgi:Dynamin family
MTELPLALKTFLLEASEKLREIGLPKSLGDGVECLAGQVDQPCVVAVVGRVKAGKSTFINALLGEDLAKVGVTETTATINYFRYGQTNPARPVRCHWQNGSVSEEDRSFLDGLQGNDTETLRRANGIKHLEYHLLNPYLENVVLVDTPGTSAVVDEHVQRTAEFLALRGQLRERQNQDTRKLGSEADAVIYLVGQVARVADQAFLDEFREVTGGRSRALNAVGVLAKIDLHPEILSRRHELSDKIAQQLKTSLNAVVPISAGIERAVDRLRAAGESGVNDFLTTLYRIPPPTLEKFLHSEEFFRELETDDCPVNVHERKQLLGDMPWAVFTALVRTESRRALTPSPLRPNG